VVATVAIDLASLLFGLPLRQLATGASLISDQINVLIQAPSAGRLSPG